MESGSSSPELLPDIGGKLDREQLTALVRWHIAKRDRRFAAAPRGGSLSGFVGYQYGRFRHRLMRLDPTSRDTLAVLWRQLGQEATEALFDRPLLTLDRATLSEITASAFWRDVLLPLDRPADVPPFFDAEFYILQQPRIDLGGFSPLAHYVLFGAGTARNPHQFFDTAWYLARNPDVVSSGKNPLLHFVDRGASEGRQPHRAVPVTWYHATYTRKDTARAAVPIAIAERCYAVHEGTSQRLASLATKRPVVCISHVFPSRPRAGNEYRISRILDWLAGRGHGLVVVVAPQEIDEPNEAERKLFFEKYPNAVICYRNGTVFVSSCTLRFSLADLAQQRIGEVVKRLRKPRADEQMNVLETSFCHDGLIGILASLARQIPDPIYYINYAFMTRFLSYISSTPRSFVDTHDVLSDKAAKVTAFGVTDNTVVSPDVESKMLRRASAIVAIQRDEEETLARLVPDRPVLTAGVDFCAPDVGMPAQEPVILVVASDNVLNVRGLQDFLRFAWPSVRAARPDAQFLVVGSVVRALRYPDPQVHLEGGIDDLSACYRRARVVINPSVGGTGLKIKSVESIAHMRPIVSFPNGIEGIEGPSLQLCYVATNWHEFAQKILHLLNPDTKPISADTVQAIQRHLEPGTVYAELDAWLTEADSKAAA